MYKKSFKSVLKGSSEYYTVQVVKNAEDEANNNNSSFKLSSMTRQDIIYWAHWGYIFLQESKVITDRTFNFLFYFLDQGTASFRDFWKIFFDFVSDKNWKTVIFYVNAGLTVYSYENRF